MSEGSNVLFEATETFCLRLTLFQMVVRVLLTLLLESLQLDLEEQEIQHPLHLARVRVERWYSQSLMIPARQQLEKGRDMPVGDDGGY